MTGGFLYTLPSYPPRLRVEQAHQGWSSPLISFGSTSSSSSSARGSCGCRGGTGRRPDAVVMDTLEQSAPQAQAAQQVDTLEALHTRMASSHSALPDAYAARPSSAEATDVPVRAICCSALPVGSIQHAVSLMALTSQQNAQRGPAAWSERDGAHQDQCHHPDASSAQAPCTDCISERGPLREPSLFELMPQMTSIQPEGSMTGISNPLLQPSITSMPFWGSISAPAGYTSMDTALGTSHLPGSGLQLPHSLTSSCPGPSMHSSMGEPDILQRRSSGGFDPGHLSACGSGTAGMGCPAGCPSLQEGEPSFSAVMMAAFELFQSEDADIPDVPPDFVALSDVGAAPVSAFLTSDEPPSSRHEIGGHGFSGPLLQMRLPSTEMDMHLAMDSGASCKAPNLSAGACTQSADVSSVGHAEGRPVRRIGSAPEAASRRRCRRGARRTAEAHSDSEGAKTGALTRVERNRIIQKEYLVRKRARQEAVHAQAAELAADVAQLRAEVAALALRNSSLEEMLARPSDEAEPPHAPGTDISMGEASDGSRSRYCLMAWRRLLRGSDKQQLQETVDMPPAQREALTILGARSDHNMAILRVRQEQAAFALLEPPPAPLSGYAVSRMQLEVDHLVGCLQETVELERRWEATFDILARQVLEGSEVDMLQTV